MKEHDGYSYGQSWADVYDDYYDNREDVEVVSAFLAKLAGTGRALEFGIGTGRVALPLADRGVEVHGIENSEEMVRRLQEKPGGDKISVVIGDMASTRVEGTFSLVYVTFSSIFMLASQEEQVRCFANAARHLEEGGVVVVDSFVPDHSRWQRGQTSSIARLELDLVDLLVALHDPVAQRINAQHVVFSGSGVRLIPLQLRYAWPSELDLMARLVGLRLRERTAGWQGEPFTGQSGWHVSVYEQA